MVGWTETKAMKNPDDCLSKQEVKTLLSVIDRPKIKLMFKTQFSGLLRIGEVVGNTVRKCNVCGFFYHPMRSAVISQCKNCWTQVKISREFSDTAICPKCSKEVELPTKPKKEWEWSTQYINRCPNCKEQAVFENGEKNYTIVKIGGIRKKDIKEETLVVHSEKKRRNKDEPIPMNQKLLAELLDYCNENNLKDDDLLFDMVRSSCQYLIKKYAEVAGLDPQRVHTHILRHSSINTLAHHAHSIAEGKVVQQRARHSNFDITLKSYIHPKQKISKNYTKELDLDL